MRPSDRPLSTSSRFRCLPALTPIRTCRLSSPGSPFILSAIDLDAPSARLHCTSYALSDIVFKRRLLIISHSAGHHKFRFPYHRRSFVTCIPINLSSADVHCTRTLNFQEIRLQFRRVRLAVPACHRTYAMCFNRAAITRIHSTTSSRNTTPYSVFPRNSRTQFCVTHIFPDFNEQLLWPIRCPNFFGFGHHIPSAMLKHAYPYPHT
jgi:hypothetical protein